MTQLSPHDEEGRDVAGEYVLGTLSPEERRAAESRIRNRPRFAQEVSAWDMRLSPLATSLPSVRPPVHLLDRIMTRIGGQGENVVRLRRQIMIWRGASAIVSALAASLALFIVVKPQPQPLEGRYVAVLNAQGPDAPFIVSIDLARQAVSVRRAGAEPQAGKSYEMWAVGGGREKPQSLGIIDAKLEIPASDLGSLDPATVFAVSLEPEGGSPTGQPTGPVLYTGKLYPIE